MRIVFSVLGLLIVLALAGLLARKQFAAQPQVVLPGTAAVPQSRLVQQQYKQALEKAMQQARPMPEDPKTE